MPSPFAKIFAGILISSSLPVHAAWFESSGQAIIENGNRQIARQKATQEAIQQALLFAGASVRSVQKMANGLLQDDSFEVRSSGEVNALELIDEIYSDGYVTVSIRADIFPQETQCKSSDYQKSVSTAWYPIKNRQQAAVGAIFDFGDTLPLRLKHKFEKTSQHAVMKGISSLYVEPEQLDIQSHVVRLAHRNNSQYVLLGTIDELSVQKQNTSTMDRLAFWQDKFPFRHFSFTAYLFDGQTGSLVSEKNYSIQAPWEFDMFQTVDVKSQALWTSRFGQEVDNILQEVAQDIDETVSCSPAYGRVLNVLSEQLQVNIGSDMGVKEGDELTLFQLNQFHDPVGQLHYQYQIHPTKVTVTQTFPASAIVVASDGSMLANVQPNDFVARK